MFSNISLRRLKRYLLTSLTSQGISVLLGLRPSPQFLRRRKKSDDHVLRIFLSTVDEPGFFMDLMDTESPDDVTQHPAVALALDMPEILEKIFGYFDQYDRTDLINAALVCRKWRDAAYHPTLWRQRTARLHLQPSDTVQLLPSLARRRLPAIELTGLSTDLRDFLPSLPSLKILRFMMMGSSNRVTDRTLRGAFQQRHTSLTEISLYNCNLITDASVILLSRRLPNLESLSMASCTRVTDVGVVAVARRLPRLHHLSVSYSAVTDAGVAALAGLRPEVAAGTPKLRFLGLAKCKITDDALQHISVGFPSMHFLNLVECDEITDAGFRHLVNMRVLSYLRVHSCKNISADGPLQLPYLEKGDSDGEYRRLSAPGVTYFKASKEHGGALMLVKCL